MKHKDRSALAIAYHSARLSPDPRTQNGSYLLSETDLGLRGIIGRNKGVQGTDFDWHTPEKYELIHHAEEHAVLGAAAQGVQTWGSTLYVPWYACLRCARSIVGAKIARVVGHKDLMQWAADLNPSWVVPVAQGLAMLADAGITCEWITGPVNAPPIRHSGLIWDPMTLTAAPAEEGASRG